MRTNEEILDEIGYIKSHKIGTKQAYRRSVKQYCNYTEMTLDELLKEAEMEEEQGIVSKNKKIKMRLLSFRQYLIENYKKNTIDSYFGCIKSLYRFYEIEIPYLPPMNLKNVDISEPITYDDLPDKVILKKAHQIASPVMKAIILFESSSGCARRETLNLTVEDYIKATSDYHDGGDIYEVIDELEKQDNVIPTFKLKRQKTNKYYYTFCSPEAVHEINTYLLSEERGLFPESQLLSIDDNYFIKKFEDINDALKLGKVGTYNRFRSHMLRKFHSSRLVNDGMMESEVDHMQGRSKSSTRESYFYHDPKVLRDKYATHLACLSVLSKVNNLDNKSKEFLEMEVELKEKDEIIVRQQKEIDTVKTRQDNLEKMVIKTIGKDKMSKIDKVL